MKKLLVFLLSCLALTGCSGHNEKGYVIEKNHREAYNTMWTQFIHVNKTLIPITYIIHHSESWTLELDEDNDGKRDYTVYLKDKDVWENIQIGDYFSWDTETCYECEQTTKERYSD